MAGQPEKRSTLGHLLNVSMPFDKVNPVWRLICKGVEELTEEFNPDTDEKQYICESVKTKILKTYAPSFEISMGYQKDGLIQYYFDVMSRRLPTGEKTAIEYIRFNKNETMFGSTDHFVGVKWNANVQFESIGGSGEDYLTSVMTVSANGDPEVGYVVVSDTGNDVSYKWEKANIEVPFVTSFSYIDEGETKNVPMGNYIPDLPIKGNALTIKGKGVVGHKIDLKHEGNASYTPVTVNASGDWTMNIAFSEPLVGIRNFSFYQKDASETNESVTTMKYSIKFPGDSPTPTTTVPVPYVLKINNINRGSVTEETEISGASFTVTGSGDSGNTISLAGGHSEFLSTSGTSTVNENGSWSLTVSIANGTNSVGVFSVIQTKNNVHSSPTEIYKAKFKNTQN